MEVQDADALEALHPRIEIGNPYTMSETRLTVLQEMALAEAPAEWELMPRFGRGWAAPRNLRERGLVETRPAPGLLREWRITDAGAALLKARSTEVPSGEE